MAAATLGLSVPKRPQITAPKFGEWLELQRNERSFERIAILVRPHVKAVGLKVNASLLHKIEGGRVPSWPLLAAFSKVYEIPMAEITLRLVAALEFNGASDLSDHLLEQQSVSQQLGGTAIDTARTRIRELEDRLKEYDAIIIELRDISTRLFAAATRHRQGGNLAHPATKSRKRA